MSDMANVGQAFRGAVRSGENSRRKLPNVVTDNSVNDYIRGGFRLRE